MTIHGNVGDAMAGLSDPLATLLRDEEAILQRAGGPRARIVPVVAVFEQGKEATAAKHQAGSGMSKEDHGGFETSIEALNCESMDHHVTCLWYLQ
jgi:hypothetical protein